MHRLIINEICAVKLGRYPDSIKRLETGYANYVYKLSFDNDKFIIRLNSDKNAYSHTLYWLDKLHGLDIPIPKVIHSGEYSDFSFIILKFIEGTDLGDVYYQLSDAEKRSIAKAIADIHNRVSKLPQNRGFGYLSSYEDENYKMSWKEVILEHLDRSRKRIKENKIFDIEKVDKVEILLDKYDYYLASIKPIPYLDDITTKNVLINQGQLSGVIDIDWICFGDIFYFVALTNMALIAMGYDTKYIDYLMGEMKATEAEREILKLYTLAFCVDFMSEKGMKFNRETAIKADEYEIKRLNEIYEEKYNELIL